VVLLEYATESLTAFDPAGDGIMIIGIGQCPPPTDEIKRARLETPRSRKRCVLRHFEFGGVF